MKRLMAEDEPKTLRAIPQGLEESRFEVDIACEGTELALIISYARAGRRP